MKKARSGSIFVSANFHFTSRQFFFRDQKGRDLMITIRAVKSMDFFLCYFFPSIPSRISKHPPLQAFCFWNPHEILCSIRAPQITLQNLSEVSFHWVESRISEHQPTYYWITLLTISSLLITRWGTEHTGNHCKFLCKLKLCWHARKSHGLGHRSCAPSCSLRKAPEQKRSRNRKRMDWPLLNKLKALSNFWRP